MNVDRKKLREAIHQNHAELKRLDEELVPAAQAVLKVQQKEWDAHYLRTRGMTAEEKKVGAPPPVRWNDCWDVEKRRVEVWKRCNLLYSIMAASKGKQHMHSSWKSYHYYGMPQKKEFTFHDQAQYIGDRWKEFEAIEQLAELQMTG